MVFNTESNIERAKKIVESGDVDQLRYACLELRFALERIAYQKLQLRLDHITIEEIGAWQPRRAMERLMELVDEYLTGDSVLQAAPEKVPGQEADKEDFVTVGTTKGVNPKDIGKHWQKLGSFLHATVPKRKGDLSRDPDEKKLRRYLNEVISYIEDVTSTGFDAYFSQNVTFQCDKCGQNIVRSSTLIKDQDVVQCQNPNCNASFIAYKKQDQFSFERYQLHFDCLSCKERTFFDSNDMLKLEREKLHQFSCRNCGKRYQVHWILRAEPVPTKSDNVAGATT